MYKVWLTIGVVGVLFVGCAEDKADANKEDDTNKTEAVTDAGITTFNNDSVYVFKPKWTGDSQS